MTYSRYMKNQFNVGDIVWGVRDRGNDTWEGPLEIKITEIIQNFSVTGELLLPANYKNKVVYNFEPTLVFATKEEALNVFGKILKQVDIKNKADKKIRKIAYGR